MTVAPAYKALADPTRREILRILREGPMAAGEIAGHFEMTWPSVSRHLRVLETSGLVESDRRRGHVIYDLRTSVLQDIVTELAELTRIGHPAIAESRRTRPRPRTQEAS
jgi:DNA-binding transcriptional ArsR family regulator